MNGSCRLPFCGPTEHAEEVDETAVFDVSREPVILNIYDMFWTNDYTANVGLGVSQRSSSLKKALNVLCQKLMIMNVDSRFTTPVWRYMEGSTLMEGTHFRSQVGN